mgnify:CR=1 FL=1
MIMQDNEKKPALRFKGFTDPWEQRKLGEICDFITKGATPTTYGFSWQPDGVPFFRNDSIKDNVFVFGEFSYISEAANEVLKRSEVHGNDILIAITGDIGKVGIIPDTVEKANINQHIARVRIRKEALPYFVYQYLASDDTQKEYQKIKTGLSMPQLSLEQVRDIVVKIPEFNEQGKIADCLRRIDTLITLHQRKYEKLVNIKKSMLDKMFPQNGESVPEIRFKGFTDPWEQRKFSELYEKVSRKNDLTYGKDDIISVANMYYKAESYITDENYLLTYNVFEMGDIAFEGNKSKNFAHGRFVENTIGNGIVSHVFDVFKPRMTNYDLQFWKYAINNERIMGPILLRSTKASTMMTNLVADDFLQENFLIPCYEEQKKIGEFLNQLDTLITLHQREHIKPILEVKRVKRNE